LDFLLQIDRSVVDKIREIIVVMYGDVSLTDIHSQEYKVVARPAENSLVWRFIECAKKPDYFRDFLMLLSACFHYTLGYARTHLRYIITIGVW